MSATPQTRLPGLVTGCLVIGVIAMGVASLAIHPLHAPRRPGDECRVSGRVTVRDCPVTRGTICFSCVMVDDSLDLETFPDVTVSIVDGEYILCEEDGLVPGRYEVTIRAHEVGAAMEGDSSFETPGRHRMRYPTPALVPVAGGSPTRVDFEL